MTHLQTKENKLLSAMLCAVALVVGCDRKERGPAYGHQEEFRKQINDSVPVKQWGYRVADVRLSEDAQKVLVVFNLPGQTNGVNELVLTNDGFRKYRGSIVDAATKDMASREYFAASAARQAARQSNMMAHFRTNQSGSPPPIEVQTPVENGSLKSMLEAGSASVVVTLPDR
jgi:hypothetical protein